MVLFQTDLLIRNIRVTVKHVGTLSAIQEQKESLRDVSLDNAKMKEKIAVIKETIGGDTQPLEEFDNELFKILVDRVLIQDEKHVTFVFESGLEFIFKILRYEL